MSIGYLFPGQGSQSIGMLADFHTLGSEIHDHLAHASEIIEIDLVKIVAHGPVELLNQTAVTQPAILAVSVGLLSLSRRVGMVVPRAVAGHSLGEYSALVASNVLDFETAIKLVHQRGLVMQSALPEGTGTMMVVLGLSDEQVQQVCDSFDGTVEIANYNSPGQVVIGGLANEMEQVAQMCTEHGARRIATVAMSVPSHCSLLASAGERYRDVLASVVFRQPNIDIYQNVNAEIATDANNFKQNLVTQLSSSVLWHQSIRSMISHGVKTFIECGPGRVLTGLMRRIDRTVNAIALSDLKSFEQLVEREQP